jgi:hypothetical protein
MLDKSGGDEAVSVLRILIAEDNILPFCNDNLRVYNFL